VGAYEDNIARAGALVELKTEYNLLVNSFISLYFLGVMAIV